MPLGGIYKEEKVHHRRTLTLGSERLSLNLGIPVLGSRREETSPLAYRNLQKQIEGLEKPGLYSRGAHVCWLADSQGRESPALVAVASLHFPIQRGQHSGPAPSTPQPRMRSRQRLGLTLQRQTRAPGMGARQSCKGHRQRAHMVAGVAEQTSSVQVIPTGARSS